MCYYINKIIMKNLFKKTIAILLIMTTVSFSLSSVIAPSNTYAFTGRKGDDCPNVLGLISWDCNVEINDYESLKTGAWIIASNVLKDLVVAAAYLILAYVIYGGYQYIFSSGEPNKMASGKKTLTNGFIGLAIVLTASIIVNAVRVALSADFSKNCFNESSCADPTTMVSGAIQWAIGVCGIVAAAFLVYGGILYISSSGDPNKTQRARQTIIYALIGLAIVAFAEIITAFVTNMINESTATKTSYLYPNNQIIIKETYDKKA